jgi:hypothetical protein
MNDEILAQIFRTLGELSGKMDALIKTDEARSERIDILDRRVSELEALRAQGKGVVAAIAVVASLIGSVVTHIIK